MKKGAVWLPLFQCKSRRLVDYGIARNYSALTRVVRKPSGARRTSFRCSGMRTSRATEACKLKHWCTSQAKRACKAARALVFVFLVDALRRRLQTVKVTRFPSATIPPRQPYKRLQTLAILAGQTPDVSAHLGFVEGLDNRSSRAVQRLLCADNRKCPSISLCKGGSAWKVAPQYTNGFVAARTRFGWHAIR